MVEFSDQMRLPPNREAVDQKHIEGGKLRKSNSDNSLLDHAECNILSISKIDTNS